MSEHFDAIRARYLNRRSVLKLGAALGLSPLTRTANAITGMRKVAQPPSFAPLARGLGITDSVADGYSARRLIAWGDGMDGTSAAEFPLPADKQARLFGFNNDFLAYIPLSGSRHGLLCVNHEYPIGHLMFPGYDSDERAKASLKLNEVASEMAAVGHSVLEIKRGESDWQLVPDSRYQRRVDANSIIAIDGPAAGHADLRTSTDPTGKQVRGILGCCSGGKTPWGTVLIAEENVGDYFRGADLNHPNLLANPDLEDVFSRWADLDPRFDLDQEPNELNRFGWVVELDPHDPGSTPVKHTALGRFEHESATVTAVPGRPLVVYSGDDSENEYVYRYVSDANFIPGDKANNSTLLVAGMLYCARFNDDGTGNWLPLVHGQGPLDAKNGFNNQGDVLINARRAATLLGATPMDRPEGIAVSPSRDRAAIALTKNKNKPASNRANPRRVNLTGHILEILPPRQDDEYAHWADSFRWDMLLAGGDLQGRTGNTGVYGDQPPRDAWLTNPDNLTFDPAGRLWVATDGMNNFGEADGVWCSTVAGAHRAIPYHFYKAPTGAEVCSPEFTPDGKTLFLSVQHPAKDDGSNYLKPSTRWPDFQQKIPPRPGVIAITRDDDGRIGD